MSESPETDATDAARRVAEESAARIAEADAKADEASYAFVTGRFDEFWAREAEAATKRVRDEYEQIVGQETDQGSGEAGG